MKLNPLTDAQWVILTTAFMKAREQREDLDASEPERMQDDAVKYRLAADANDFEVPWEARKKQWLTKKKEKQGREDGREAVQLCSHPTAVPGKHRPALGTK